MKKTTRIILLATAILFITQTTAQAIIFLYRSGFYVSGSGSIDWGVSNDVSVNVSSAVPTTRKGTVLQDTGVNANLAFGYYMDQWRIEAEGNYRTKQDTPFSYGGVTVKRFGYVSQYSVMANAYYDVPLCVEAWGVYGGAGVGCAWSAIELNGLVNGTEHQARFAAQVIGGTFYNITPCITVTLAYRFFVTTSPAPSADGVGFSNGITTAIITASTSPIVQSVELGLRISLF